MEVAYFVCFFFFQAEDGIRDYKVTGVQTCALPILIPIWTSSSASAGPSSMTRARLCFTPIPDRKSTRLNSSHLVISYAVFCLKKKINHILSSGAVEREFESRAGRAARAHVHPLLAVVSEYTSRSAFYFFFFFNDTATTEIYTLSLHDALPDLQFEFHYFFMRKLWFAYLSKALIVFPGGFGTLDEMMEVLTLTQTQKLAKKVAIVLYGSSYWKEIVNFDALVRHGTISPEDLNLFRYADDPETAFGMLKEHLTTYLQPETPETPAISKSRNPQKPAGA